MSENIDNHDTYHNKNLERYLQANLEVESNRHHIESKKKTDCRTRTQQCR